MSSHRGLRSRAVRIAILLICVVSVGTSCSTEAKKARHLERGEEYLAEGKIQEAIIEFLNVVQLDENDCQATMRLAVTLYDTGQLGPALRYLQRASACEPDNHDIRVKLATLYLYGGRREQAREEAGVVLDADPKNLDALNIYADTADTPGEIDGAIRRLESSRAENEDRARFHLALGALHLRKQDMEAAESYLQEAAKREPDSPDAHLALGTFYAGRRELEQAEEEFALAAEVAPVRSAVQIRVVDFYRLLGRQDEANARLERIVAEAPDFLPAWRRIAQYAFADRDFERCHEALSHILDNNPRDADALILSGEAYSAQGKNDEAEVVFRDAVAVLQDLIRRRPEQAQAHFRVAQVHARLDEFEQARSSLETVLELRPNSIGAQMLLAELNLRHGYYDDAIRLLEELDTRHSTVKGYELLGRSYMGKREFAPASQYLGKGVEAEPNNPELRRLYAASLAGSGDLPGAIREFENALELAPASIHPLTALAAIDVRRGRVQAAIDRVRAQLPSAPDSARHHYLLGSLYALAEQQDEAEAALLESIELDPQLTAGYAQLANLYVKTNRHERALEEMRRGREKDPMNESIRMLEAVIVHQLGDLGEAQTLYEELLGINPRFAVAANNLAYLYQQQGKLDEAFELAEIAYDEAPENPDIQDTFGWILYQRGTYERALGLLSQAAEERADNAEIQYHLGLAHHRMGDTEETIRVLERALELDPDFRLANEARTVLDELR